MSKIQNPKSKIDKAPLVLAIDVGSSSIRTSLYTDGAERLDGSEVQLSYDMRLTPDGGTEIDPRKLLDCLSSALDRTLKKAGQKAGSIQGVGMCSLVGNVLGVDTKGQPTTPIYTWADTRPSKEAAELRAALDGEALRQRTGCPIHSSYLPARLLWLKRTMSKAFTQTAQWVSLGEWVHLRLFGEAGQSLSVASWGGLLNRFTLDWDAELLSFLDLDRSQLPPLVDNDTALRGLRASYAKRWPALRDVPWFPCIADGVAGNLGCGCVTEKDVAVQVGTSGAMRA